MNILNILPGVQFSQLQHSMGNEKIYKCLPHIFALALTFYEEKFFFKFFISKKLFQVTECNIRN